MALARRRCVYFQARPEEYEPEEPTFTPELQWILRFIAKWLLTGIAILVVLAFFAIIQSPKRHIIWGAAHGPPSYVQVKSQNLKVKIAERRAAAQD